MTSSQGALGPKSPFRMTRLTVIIRHDLPLCVMSVAGFGKRSTGRVSLTLLDT